MGLGYAHRELVVSQLFSHLDLFLGYGTESDGSGAIQVARYLGDLLFNAVVVVIGHTERSRRPLLDSIYHQIGQFYGTGTSFGKGVVNGETDSHFLTVATYHFNFFVHIVRITVESHHNRLPERTHVADVLVKIGQTVFQTFHIRFLDGIHTHATVHLQSLGGGHNHCKLRLQTGLAAFDIKEFLGSQIGAESGFRNDVITEGHRHLGGQDGITAVCDVGERTSMHKCRSMFRSLHQIRSNRIFQEHRNGSRNTQVLDRERFVVYGIPQQDILDTAAQVVLVGSQTKDCHDFGSRRNVEGRFTGNAVRLTSQTGYDVTQAAVVHVHHTVPQDLFHGEALILVLVHVVVQQCCNHVMCRCDGMEVAGKMQVDLVHRKNLGVTSSCRSTLHSETRAQRRFTEGTYRVLAYLVQP